MKRMSIAEQTLEKQAEALRKERREMETRMGFLDRMIYTLEMEQSKLRNAREQAPKAPQGRKQ